MKSLAVLLTAALALGGCQSSTDEAETETADTSLAVEAAVPEVGDLSVSSTFIGTISPQEQVSIIPLVSGEVSSVHFQVGDQVQAGDVLLQIDDEAARLQLESARLTKEGAELSAQRTLGSSQVMSNLSMESNIKNIQYQIDMAKKQYNTAGNSITDTQQKKEDMKSALDKINDSIGDMESSYNNMKNMAKTAKQYVYQDTYGVWRWITDPEPNWGEEYETTPSTGTQPSETSSAGDSSTGSTTPGGNPDSLNTNGGLTAPGSSSSGNGGTNSSGQNSSEEAPEEEEKEESSSQEESKSEGTGQNSAKDEESKSSAAESPAVQESPSVPESPSGNETKAQGVAFIQEKVSP